MAERPILFSDEMVRAILDGRKTQTRRLVTPGTAVSPSAHLHDLVFADAWVDPGPSPAGNPGPYLKAPDIDVAEGAVHRVYSRIWSGDLLYVRECWAAPPGHYDLIRPRELPRDTPIRYKADGAVRGDSRRFVDEQGRFAIGRGRPSIHMPRWASRLLLRVTEVRVERVQDITEEDALEEGVQPYVTGHGPVSETDLWCEPGLRDPAMYRRGFEDLWDSLAQPGSTWAANPWVWVVSFKVEEPSHD